MVRLVPADYDASLRILAASARGTRDEPIPGDALEAIRRLIGADTLGLFEGLPWERARRHVWIAGDHATWTEQDRALLDRYRFQLPTLPSPRTMGRSVRTSDVANMKAFRKLEIHQLVGRPHGIEYSMEYWMRTADGVIHGLAFDRSGGDFTERDRDVLDVLGTHLAAVLGRFDPRLAAADRIGLSPRQAEILAWVSRGLTNEEIGRTLSVSPHTVRKHLENAFERLGVHTRGAALAAVYEGRGAPASARHIPG
jgi:DNA-binding CsgD family transcriptional regulator